MTINAGLGSLTCLALLLGGCNGLVDKGAEAPALATLRGEMSLAPGAPAVEGQLRLAIAWYPGFFNKRPTAGVGGLSGDCLPNDLPSGIVSQSLTFAPTFPIAYALDLKAPPPATALAVVASESGPAKAAFGAVVAYDDRNGSMALEPCSSTGACPDTVLGASGSFGLAESGGDNLFILYVDQAFSWPSSSSSSSSGAAAATIVPAGFHLLKLARAQPPAAVEPILLNLDTKVDIALGRWDMQHVICDQVCTTLDSADIQSCGFASESEVCPAPAPVPPGSARVCLGASELVIPDAMIHVAGQYLVVSPSGCNQRYGSYSVFGTHALPSDWPCP